MATRVTKSDWTFIALILIAAISKVIWTVAGLDHPIIEQYLCTWPGIGIATILGYISFKLAEYARFPGFWDEKVRNRQRFLVPLVAGIFFGLIQIIFGILGRLPDIHVDFPLSIPVYLSGAIVLEIMWHFFPIVLLVWLASRVILKQRWHEGIYWMIAVPLSLLEPIAQMVAICRAGVEMGAVTEPTLFLFILLSNLLLFYFLRRFGFLAMLTFRFSFYVVWHVMYGGFWA